VLTRLHSQHPFHMPSDPPPPPHTHTLTHSLTPSPSNACAHRVATLPLRAIVSLLWHFVALLLWLVGCSARPSFGRHGIGGGDAGRPTPSGTRGVGGVEPSGTPPPEPVRTKLNFDDGVGIPRVDGDEVRVLNRRMREVSPSEVRSHRTVLQFSDDDA
jgi:hypothetical protein